MLKNKYRLLILGLIGGCALWFSVFTCLEWLTYSKLKVRYPAQITSWEIIEKNSSQFALRAGYIYEVKGKTHHGSTTLKKPYHLNRAAAESAIEVLNAQSNWAVWVNPRKESFSSLERSFPVKNFSYSIIAIGVLVYWVSIPMITSMGKSLDKKSHQA